MLFVIPTLHGGGAERVIVTLLRHMDRSRFRLALAVVDCRGAVYGDEIPADVELIDLAAGRVRYALPRIIVLLLRRRPDVLFSTLSHLNLALAIVRPLLMRRVRFIVRETSIVSRVLQTKRLGWIWRALYRSFYPRVDLLISQSTAMLDDLVQNLGFPREKAIVIHNPLEIERIRGLAREKAPEPQFDPAATNLVAAGRVVEVKGFDILIEALALCANQRLRLTILGEGPLIPELERLAADRGVAARVRFVGFQRNPYPYYAQADWFVLSSRHEGFPNAVLEALCCGTPVVAMPAPGGIREMLVDVPHTRFANDLTANGLAACLAGLPTKGDRVPLHAVERFAVSRVVDQFARAFQ